MRYRGIAGVIVALAAGFYFSATGISQDLQKSYTVGAEGIIRISNISGEINVQGYEGNSVIVEAFKTGRDREHVEIVDRSSENRVDLDVHYPERGSSDAGVNFQVRVPRGTHYRFETIRSVSGNVSLRDVTGHVVAVSISGSIEVANADGMISATATSGNVNVTNISGMVSATSISGNVNVLLKRIAGSGEMKFTSISGNVVVRAPANLDASVSMSTLSGSLTTDFPIDIQQRRYVPRYSARGRLGNGASSILIRSVSGRVSLMKN